MDTKASRNIDIPTTGSRYLESLRRWIYAFLGILMVGIGAIGVFVPGLPTTIFLLAACYLFTRSCPVLERILIRNRFFAAFHPYLDGSVEMPLRAKLVTLLIMWSFITVSSTMLYLNQSVPIAIVLIIPLAGIVGTYFVLRFGTNSKSLPRVEQPSAPATCPVRSRQQKSIH